MAKAKAKKVASKSPEVLQFEKDYTALKHYLIGRSYHSTLAAIGIAQKYHTGTRKDGKTPEFHHQVRICFTIIGLRDVEHEEKCLTAAILHDLFEDYDVSLEDVRPQLEKLCDFSELIFHLQLLNKHNTPNIMDLACDPVASIDKGADNCDNTLTMTGVFSIEKMRDYIARTEREILPMLKEASRNFPNQHFAYASLRTLLKKQLLLARAYISVAEAKDTSDKRLEAENARLKQQCTQHEAFTKILEADLKEAREMVAAWKESTVGDKTRRMITVSQVMKEAYIGSTGTDQKVLKEALTILGQRYGISPSILSLADGSIKLDEKLAGGR